MMMSAPAVDKGAADEEEEEEDEQVCRICKVASKQPLISPCYCKGSLGSVHATCLQQWLGTTTRTSCEICNFHFETLCSRKYSLLQAARLWLSIAHHRRQFKADICNICLLTTVLTLVLFICIVRLDSATEQGIKKGVSKFWTVSIMGFFLTLVTATYSWSVFYLVRKQISPFLTWWRSTHNIFLRLHDHQPPDAESSTQSPCPAIQIVIR